MLLGTGAAGLWKLLGDGGNGALPALGTLPPFRLVERSGRTVTQADLAGEPWVADFVFTRCAGTCPLLSARMAALATQLERRGVRGVRLVSFSVDPAHDTPEVLRDYARGFGASADRWLFLTGERDSLYRLIHEGFRLAVGEDPQAGPGELITHSDRFVLVDGRLRIRGYYRGTEGGAVEQVLADLAKLGVRGAR